ncbi:MAG: TetR/AcrR family transcriptional regulator [Ilumatobacter sp.]|nr:TetR/AcrR family transcriptional regulator [Ilumatobacter sp.]
MANASMLDALSDRQRSWTPTEVRVLEAVKTCCERWGVAKVTIDDIARASGVSRATLYRIFPGGKDIVFEAHRVYELDRFFTTLLGQVAEAETLEDLLVSAVTCATRELRADEHLARMMSTEPGEVLTEMTVAGLPRIVSVATEYLVPLVDRYLPRTEGRALIEMVVRLVISYFLAPSELVDLADEQSAQAFLEPFLPALDTLAGQHAPASHPSPGASTA